MAETFSVNEAAAIAEVSPETIRTALEKNSVTPSHQRKAGKSVRHQFSVGDVLFIKLLAEFPFPLSKQDKQSLAHVVARGNRKASLWSMEGPDLVYRSGGVQLSLQCKTLRKTVDKNLATFRWGRKRVVSSPEVLGGEPVFRGTRIPLRHVASLFRKGVSEQEIVEDFPSLSVRDLAYARLFSRFGDKPGRPAKAAGLSQGSDGRVAMRLLLDENISPALVGRLAEIGIYAQSVPHVGLSGRPDRVVWKYALDNDLAVVTATHATSSNSSILLCIRGWSCCAKLA
jgi:uncharacterized protein (DUF433 family)